MTAFIMVFLYMILTTVVGKALSRRGDRSTQQFFVAKKGLGIGLTVAI